jgi:hypothetical protein
MVSRKKLRQWWRDDENILIINAGQAALAVPRSWEVEGKAEGLGYMNLKDPSDSCALQISCIAIPPLVPEAPPFEAMLRDVAVDTHPSAALAPIHTVRRGQMELAWVDCSYPEQDTERDELRTAHARILFAARPPSGALLTFYYWEDDTAWAVAAWERMVETLRLNDPGVLARPHPSTRRN